MPRLAGASERAPSELHRDPVKIFLVTGGSTTKEIVDDLGIADAALSDWIRAAGVAVGGSRGPVVVCPGHERAKSLPLVAGYGGPIRDTCTGVG